MLRSAPPIAPIRSSVKRSRSSSGPSATARHSAVPSATGSQCVRGQRLPRDESPIVQKDGLDLRDDGPAAVKVNVGDAALALVVNEVALADIHSADERVRAVDDEDLAVISQIDV